MSEVIAVISQPQLLNVTVKQTENVVASSNLANPAVVESISDIGNVDTTNVINGSVLVFKTTTNKWTSTTTLDAQNMEGGEF